MVRFFLAVSVAFILLIGAGVGFLVFRDEKPDYDVPLNETVIPEFSMVEIPFHHIYQASRRIPYTAGAVIDVDNDGVEELFLGGGVRQSDGLFVFTGEGFVNVADQVNLIKLGDDVTLGAAVIDFDNNGYQDLVISRESGIWLYSNYDGKFEMERLDLGIPTRGVPLAVAVADLNLDGHFDFFLPIVTRTSMFDWLSGPSESSGIQPRLYINNGDTTFFDSTESAGLDAMTEARQAIFLDLDDDGKEDLTVFHTDGTLSTWKNRDSLLFENKHASLQGGYMGLGAGDYNSDGHVDFLLTNRGETLPQLFLKVIQSKRLDHFRNWILLKNKGYFSFEDAAKPTRLSGDELARGSLFTDLNNDGRTDLVVSQNHPYWLPHWLERLRLPGRTLLQNQSGAFAEVGELTGLTNSEFGVAPLQADFNMDGLPDIIHLNLDGKSRIFLSKPGKNNYLIVQLDDSVRSLGATVYVKTLSGKTMKKIDLAGNALCSDSSHRLFFGLADDKAVDVIVEYSNGETDQTSGVLFNKKITF